MRSEDEAQRLLRLLHEERASLVERIAQGGVSADNVAGGYRELTGMVKGLDTAVEYVKDVFKGWLPDDIVPTRQPPRKLEGYLD